MTHEVRPELYIDDRWLVSLLKASIVCVAVGYAAMFLSAAVRTAVLASVKQGGEEDAFGSEPLLEIAALADLGVAVLTALVAMVSGVLFLKWFGRANHNLSRAMGEPLEFTPSGCIWAFIVPVVNLWWPVRAMTEMIRACDRSTESEISALERLAGQWWFVFWVSSVGDRIAGKMEMRASTIDEQYSAAIASSVSSVLDVAERVLAFWVVSELSKRIYAKAVTDGVVAPPVDGAQDDQS
jgi:hypothetical protein